MAKKYIVWNDEDGELQEFTSTDEVEKWLEDDYDGDYEALRVFEIATEYEVTKRFDLKEI